MSCCAPGAELALAKVDPHTANEEVLLASRIMGDGVSQTDLSVPGIHCGGCIQKVEAALGALPCDRTTRIARTWKTQMSQEELSRRTRRCVYRVDRIG